MSSIALLDHFSALKDPRQAWKVLYPLPEVLLTVLCATMAGAEDFADFERWGKRKLDFLRHFLPFERGRPLPRHAQRPDERAAGRTVLRLFSNRYEMTGAQVPAVGFSC